MTYKLVCHLSTGSVYEVELTRFQAEHMLSLWGEQYDIEQCTLDSPISSPSGFSKVYLSVPVLS